MENEFRIPAQPEPFVHHQKNRGLITPWLTFSVTALISINFCAFYLMILSGVEFPIWFKPFMWLVAVSAFLTLLVLTPLHAVATLADILTKRYGRAYLAFVSMALGAGTMFLMVYELNSNDTSSQYPTYSELSSPLELEIVRSSE